MDYISDILIRIKNANQAHKPLVALPYSDLGVAIGEALAKAGYTGAPEKKGKRQKLIELPLVYENGEPKIRGVKRLSKQSKRVYTGASGLRPVRNGFGKIIVSTSKGVMSGEDAKKEQIGGEVLFEIW